MGKKFYKYRSAEKLLKYKELERQEIFFATPKELNDPMEAYKTIVFKGDEILWHNLFTKYFHFYAEIIYQEVYRHSIKTNSFEYVYKIFINNINNLVSTISKFTIYKHELTLYLLTLTQYIDILLFEFYSCSKCKDFQENLELRKVCEIVLLFINGLLLARKKHYKFNMLSALLTSPLSQIFKMDIYTYRVSLFIEQLENLMSPKVISTSFSETCNNTLMWTHYSENHTGVCLIFDTKENNSFELSIIDSYNRIMIHHLSKHMETKPRIRNKYIKDTCVLKPIVYKLDLKPINFFENILPINEKLKWYTSNITNEISSLYQSNINNSIIADVTKNFMNKANKWKYEKEWRIAYFYDLNISIPTKLRKFKYDFNSLNGIIFGIRTPAEVRHKIISIIANKCKKVGRKKFNFYDMQIDTNNGNLKKIRINIDINDINNKKDI